jgi:hypothetical protein
VGAFSALLDGSWVDICSLAGALVYAAFRCYRTRKKGIQQRIVSKVTGIDVANGVSLFPLLLLCVGSISSSVLTALVQSNKLILSVAGIVAILAILDEG